LVGLGLKATEPIRMPKNPVMISFCMGDGGDRSILGCP
jgi:hypothetical protein